MLSQLHKGELHHEGTAALKLQVAWSLGPTKLPQEFLKVAVEPNPHLEAIST